MFKCYLCQQDLIPQKTESKEHIIPNALGGRLLSKKLLCIHCNSTLGSSIDADLANQFNSIAAMLNIIRDDGTPKAFDAQMEGGGEKYKIEPGGKPRLLKPEIERDTSTIKIKADSVEQIKTILEREQKRGRYLNLNLNIDNIINKIKEYIEDGKLSTERYLNEPLTFDMQPGGVGFWRAICKIATNFYIFSGEDNQHISHLIPYIKCGIQPSRLYAYFFNRDNLFPRYLEADLIIHSLYLKSEPATKSIYMLIELFSTFQFVVLLSDKYNGQEFKHLYSYNVLERKYLDVNYNLEISLDEINQALSGKFDDLIFSKKNNELLGFIHKKQILDHLNELNISTINNVLSQVPEGELIPKEVWNSLFEQIALNSIQVQLRQIIR
jgi:hypothetical protein